MSQFCESLPIHQCYEDELCRTRYQLNRSSIFNWYYEDRILYIRVTLNITKIMSMKMSAKFKTKISSSFIAINVRNDSTKNKQLWPLQPSLKILLYNWENLHNKVIKHCTKTWRDFSCHLHEQRTCLVMFRMLGHCLTGYLVFPFKTKFLHKNELILQRKESSLLEFVNTVTADLKSGENTVLIS